MFSAPISREKAADSAVTVVYGCTCSYIDKTTWFCPVFNASKCLNSKARSRKQAEGVAMAVLSRPRCRTRTRAAPATVAAASVAGVHAHSVCQVGLIP